MISTTVFDNFYKKQWQAKTYTWVQKIAQLRNKKNHDISAKPNIGLGNITILSFIVTLTLSWPDFPTDMYHCAKNTFIKLTILVKPIKLHIKMFLTS